MHSPDRTDQGPCATARTSKGAGDEDPRLTAAREAYVQERKAGRIPSRKEFLARYPELADQLAGLEFLHSDAFQNTDECATLQFSGDHRLAPHATLGDFQLIRQIGHGGMGVVYEAEQLSLGRKVAVKVLPFAAMLNKQHRKRFHNEARAAATLDHPNIVPVYFVGQERGIHFFAMHLIEGQSLAELIEGLRGISTNHPPSLPLASQQEATVGRGSRGHARETLSGPVSPTPPKRGLTNREPKALAADVQAITVVTSKPDASVNGSEVKTDSSDLLEEQCQKVVPSVHETEVQSDFQSAVSTQRSERPNEFFQTAARLGAEAAEALEHAHQLGILHRDIKPGNLLIDSTGKLWVADFGLATIEHDETLTRTGGVVGTAAYMSPEQASDSHRIDGRSDVYSLGATLYELLTLRRYRSDDLTVTTSSGRPDHGVESPNRMHATVPVDLETIVIKALASDPSDRYQSAHAMADDLRLFIDGREIKARRLTLVQRFVRWLRCHQKLTTAAIVASFLVITVFGTAMSVYSRKLSNHARQLGLALADARDSRIEAEQQTKLAQSRLERAERSEQLALQSEQAAKESELFARKMSYRSDTQRAYEHFSQQNYVGTFRLLQNQVPRSDQVDLRGVEWRLLNAELDAKYSLLGSHEGAATESVLYPDGKTVATAGEDGLVHLWDITNKQRLKTFQPKIGAIHAMAVSPDGKTLAVGGAPTAGYFGSAAVHLLNAKTGKPLRSFQRHPATIESIEFSPDGTRIAAGSRYEFVKLSTVEGKELHQFPGNGRNCSIAFSPDGRQIAMRFTNRVIRLWDCESGEVSVEVPIWQSPQSLQWSATGDTLIVASKNTTVLNLFDAKTGRHIAKLGVMDQNSGGITALAVSIDRQTLIAGDLAGRVHRWRIDESLLQARSSIDSQGPFEETSEDSLIVQNTRVLSALSLDSDEILTTHNDGNVILLRPNQTAARVQSLDFDMTAVGLAKGQAVYVGSSDGSVRRFDLQTSLASIVIPESGTAVEDIAVTIDGSRMAVVNDAGQLNVIDLSTGSTVWSTTDRVDDNTPLYHVAISPDGALVARTGSDDRLVVWKTGQQKSLFSATLSGDGLAVAFSPDGKMIAFGRERLKLLSVSDWNFLESFNLERLQVLEFSPDGNYLASGLREGGISLLDLSSKKHTVLRGHVWNVTSVAFGRDGESMLSADWLDNAGVSNTILCSDVTTSEMYGAIHNPLPQFDRDKHRRAEFKVFALDDFVVLCGLHLPYAKIAIWDLNP